MRHTTLPLVAKALGEKYDIQVQISGDQAYTNGKIINLPSMPDSKEAALLARGYIDHESAHIRFTDFSVKCGNPMLKCLTNILEDIRIEKMMGAKYPGCRSNLKDLAEHLKQQHGFVHGGVLAYLADNALTYAGGTPVVKVGRIAGQATHQQLGGQQPPDHHPPQTPAGHQQGHCQRGLRVPWRDVQALQRADEAHPVEQHEHRDVGQRQRGREGEGGQQRELGVGEVFGFGAVLLEAQQPDRLLQQLVFNRQPAAFGLGSIALAQDALEHRAQRFGKRVEIERGGHV